ncbi:MAG TPA: cell division protein ZapB [bacterium]|nr:cell division protein ZapB [bacterium]
MISLEQVHALESRVEKAVALIASLRTENASLRSGLATAEARVAELEALVAEFQKDQARIEAGIIEALRKLDSFEDSVHEAVATKPSRQSAQGTPAQDTVEPAAEPETPPVTDGADALDLF